MPRDRFFYVAEGEVLIATLATLVPNKHPRMLSSLKAKCRTVMTARVQMEQGK